MPVGITDWSQVQFMDLPGATRDSAFGINDAGWIVGSINDSAGIHGYL
jgi:hypothetical protein